MIAVNAGQESIENFRADYREMLLSFNADTAFEAITSWARTEATALVKTSETADDLETVVELGFARLYQRGAIQAIRPFSVQGQQQLNAILSMNKPTAAASPVNVTTLDDVVADFNGRLSTAQFKKKCQADPKYFKLYEKAVAEGRV